VGEVEIGDGDGGGRGKRKGGEVGDEGGGKGMGRGGGCTCCLLDVSDQLVLCLVLRILL
jgi:hypothetical protein